MVIPVLPLASKTSELACDQKEAGDELPIPTTLLGSIVKAVSVPTVPLSFILNLPLSE